MQLFYLGIFIGLMLERYIFPIFDIYFEIFNHKKAEQITLHNLNMKAMNLDFTREYPEASGDPYQQIQAIGFEHPQAQDEGYGCVDRNKIGF